MFKDDLQVEMPTDIVRDLRSDQRKPGGGPHLDISSLHFAALRTCSGSPDVFHPSKAMCSSLITRGICNVSHVLRVALNLECEPQRQLSDAGIDSSTTDQTERR